jgi:hypothetical protein
MFNRKHRAKHKVGILFLQFYEKFFYKFVDTKIYVSQVFINYATIRNEMNMVMAFDVWWLACWQN